MRVQFIVVALLGFVIGVAACFFVLVVNENLYTYSFIKTNEDLARGCSLVSMANGGSYLRCPRFFIGS